ncbi:MAG TPA: hypothetical protein VH643_03260 [Gemmataceae bacterium]|jgi:hypothetical protein
MRCAALLLSLLLVFAVSAAEVESRLLTHYVPQDLLETTVRTEKWSEVPLAVKGGLRKGDVVRIWAGGLIDRGDGETPGQKVNGPAGAPADPVPGGNLALAPDTELAYALLFKSETSGPKKCLAAGKPLEIKLGKDGERLWVGFNDERGRYLDNHLGKGRRHEFDPLWVRIEVVRIVID